METNDSNDLARLDLLIEDLEVAHNQIGQAEPSIKKVLDELRMAAENPKKHDVLVVEFDSEYNISLVRERLNRALTALTHAEQLQRQFGRVRGIIEQREGVAAGGGAQQRDSFNRPRFGQRERT